MIEKIASYLHFSDAICEPHQAMWVDRTNISLDVLRLDKLHEHISGNKWFKLKYYVEKAVEQGFQQIVTTGGTYSNHLVATAFICNTLGIRCTAVIRGKKVENHSIEMMRHYNMQILFVEHNAYKQPQFFKENFPNHYFIPMGGYGSEGCKGAGEILSLVNNLQQYQHIICAVGTGTMLAGLITASSPHQVITGISVLKGNQTIEEEIRKLLPNGESENVHVLREFHFGGYAKFNSELLQFMTDTWHETMLPTDFVYTGKTLFGIKQLAEKNHFNPGSKVLMIHSGGLQGNKSLPVGVLPF